MKHFFCVLLCLAAVFTLTVSTAAYNLWQTDDPDIVVSTVTADEAIAQYESQTGEKVETYRCYFQMPDGVHGVVYEDAVAASWYNDCSQGAGIYWWEGPAACESWPGYRANVADAGQHIYYADVPVQVERIIWNNGVDSGTDPQQIIYNKMKSSVDINCIDIEPGEYDTMPEGAESLDGCIVIADPEVSTSVLQPITRCFIYFYYGDGCYGMYATDSENFVDIAHNCCNPDHFDENGDHVGFRRETTRGDYDGDGIVTILDATRVQRMLADLDERPDEAFLTEVDADGDGELGILDATRIQRVIAELCDWDGHIFDEYELPFVLA